MQEEDTCARCYCKLPIINSGDGKIVMAFIAL
jgi:hypothetical protein